MTATSSLAIFEQHIILRAKCMDEIFFCNFAKEKTKRFSRFL